MAIFTMVGGKGKGGGDINFEVVGALDKPANPIENTLWVETEYNVDFWEMDFVKPETAEERTVWIGVSTESDGAFNALKENELMLYPVDCMQFLNGEWVARGLQIYQNGEWVEITPTSFPTGQSICKIGTGALVSIVEDGTPVNFYVASLDYEPSLNNASRVLLVRQGVHSKRKLNDTGNNAYADSSIDTWLNGDYKALFASDVQNLMGETKFKYTPGNGNKTLSELTRSVFLLSATEYGLSVSAGVSNVEGSALPVASTLRTATFNGAAVEKFTRTPNNSGTDMNVVVYTNGTLAYMGSGASIGIVPAFTVPKSVLVSPEPNEDGAYELTGISGSAKIYGISRDITASSPEWARTDGAVGFTATASVGTVAGSSSFDNIYPWSEIKRETLDTGDVMVKIPKFWYKRFRDGNIEHIQIADKAVEGFTLHPAFNHAGVESEGVYVGAYRTSDNNKSVTAASSTTNVTRANFRNYAKNNGGGWGCVDISAISAIQMLMLVEFATNNVQAVIGSGFASTGSFPNTGTCDSVPNLTGRPDGTANKVDVVWRGIESLWSNNWEYVDGVNWSKGSYYVCNDPSKYADDKSAGYDLLSYGCAFASGGSYIKEVGLDTNGNDHILLPTSFGGSASTYYCDGFYGGNNEWAVCARGGHATVGDLSGLFALHALNASSATGPNSRLLYIPPYVPTIATASTTPTSGVTYTDGIDGLSAEVVSLFSKAISNNNAITSETTEVYIDAELIHRKLSVGNQTSLALNGTAYTFDIIGFNHDPLTDAAAYGKATATGKAGITFQMHGCFADTYTMNASQTNKGGWKDSAMRTTTMPLMKGYLPSKWQSLIKSVEKSTGLGGGSTEGTEITSDELFVLSEVEVFGEITKSVYGEGYQYAYYKKGNEKIKLLPNNTAREWSERSPGKTNSLYFCRIGKDGTAGETFGNTLSGLAFAFCV